MLETPLTTRATLALSWQGNRATLELREVTPPGHTRVSARTYREMRRQPYRGDYYLSLMSHNVSSKTDSHVSFTKNPVRDIFLHNERLIPGPEARNTCVAAPHWQLDIVIGPFVCRGEALDCGHAWVRGTRGKKAKRKKAPVLAALYNKPLYDWRQQLPGSFTAFLVREAGPHYASVYEQMCGDNGSDADAESSDVL